MSKLDKSYLSITQDFQQYQDITNDKPQTPNKQYVFYDLEWGTREILAGIFPKPETKHTTKFQKDFKENPFFNVIRQWTISHPTILKLFFYDLWFDINYYSLIQTTQ